MEESGPGRSASDFIESPRASGERGGGIESHIIPTDRPTQSRVELVEKNQALPVEPKRQRIEGDHPQISVRRQCTLLGLPRSSLYYQPRGESAETLHLMRLLDMQYTATPFYGIRRMTAWLRAQEYQVNHKRVARLMQQMGIEAIYTKPHLSQATAGQVIYPYLLRGVKVARINHVWSTDITYIRLHQGFVSLVAVMDWFSRYVLSWALSVTLDGQFCREALTQALRHGSRPEIFNTDQGVQFTSSDFTSYSSTRAFRSVWTDVGGRWTTSSWSASGEPSSMRRCT